jgi:hypothetical protein
MGLHLGRRRGSRLKLERCMRYGKKTETMSMNKSDPGFSADPGPGRRNG